VIYDLCVRTMTAGHWGVQNCHQALAHEAGAGSQGAEPLGCHLCALLGQQVMDYSSVIGILEYWLIHYY
jgi:hypothetical protein